MGVETTIAKGGYGGENHGERGKGGGGMESKVLAWHGQ